MTVQRLRGLSEPDPQAIEAYRSIVGASREVAALFVIDELGLEPDLRPVRSGGHRRHDEPESARHDSDLGGCR